MNLRLLLKQRSAVVICGIAVVALVVFHSERVQGQEGGQAVQSFTVAVFGDMPYGDLGRSQYPALLADINASHIAFSVYDGDLKAGGDGPCSDSLYTTALDNFNKL